MKLNGNGLCMALPPSWSLSPGKYDAFFWESMKVSAFFWKGIRKVC